jgi:isoaspartyl peptidase/L-asparaginase-like protein (Ntn-hydrolase superfamily)
MSLANSIIFAEANGSGGGVKSTPFGAIADTPIIGKPPL